MNLRKILLICAFLTASAGWADIDLNQQDFGSENIEQPAKRTPFSLAAEFDSIGKSEIDKGRFKHDKIRYTTGKIEAGMVFYYQPRFTEGLRLAVSYNPTDLRWSGRHNPHSDHLRFNNDCFHIVSFTLGGFTQRLDSWFWRAQFSVNMDTEEFSMSYTSYDIVLWGRYAYNQKVGFHIGFWAETGLQMDRVYPILGFDWQISRRWKLNLVFPTNIALDFLFRPNWTVSIAGRFFDSRFRTHNSHLHHSLIRYTNAGGEFAIKYDNKTLSANLHAGYTLGGRFREANRHNHHAHSYNLDPAFYAGGEIDFKF